MAHATQKKFRPTLNPEMLRWAREWRGRTLEEAARRVQKTPADIEEWEKVPGGPTIRQARELAELYGRPFLEFFRSAPPPIKEPELVPDLRVHRDAPDPRETRELKRIQSWAEAQRQNALDLYEEIGDAPPNVPPSIFATVTSSPDDAAENARAALKFEFGEQFDLPTSQRDQFPNIMRGKFERAGILTLRRSDVSDVHVRGICIATFPLPIVIYGSESPGAQAFTLAHELGHIVLRESAISGPRNRDNPYAIERWCDRFSAAFLMPKMNVKGVVGSVPRTPWPNISDERLESLARLFRVSPHAMLIRMVHLGYVDPAYYWGVKKPLFEEQEAAYKSHARSKYYGSRYKSSLGDLYTGLVLEAWNTGRITNHSAAEYMGIENFEHLYAIRDHFESV
jgi:Zn-dependent peptidase ImmA (M78 family)